MNTLRELVSPGGVEGTKIVAFDHLPDRGVHWGLTSAATAGARPVIVLYFYVAGRSG